jgi:hypothetical protein
MAEQLPMTEGCARWWREQAAKFRKLKADMIAAGEPPMSARHTDGTVIPDVVSGSIRLCEKFAREAARKGNF